MAIAEELSLDFEAVDAELNYIVDDGQPSIRYVDWPEEAHNEHIPPYERRRTRIQATASSWLITPQRYEISMMRMRFAGSIIRRPLR